MPHTWLMVSPAAWATDSTESLATHPVLTLSGKGHFQTYRHRSTSSLLRFCDSRQDNTAPLLRDYGAARVALPEPSPTPAYRAVSSIGEGLKPLTMV
jgi:hypothetical protein